MVNDNKKTIREITILGILLFILIGLFTVVSIKIKIDEKKESRKVETKEELKEDKPIKEEEKQEEKKDEQQTSQEETTTDLKNEDELVTYISKLNNDLDNSKSDEASFKEKAKNTFTTVVDFLFYDKEIKGYKFKDLTLKTKLQVLKIAASIDNKIDSYFPNYKDSIKAGYNNIKGKIAVLYLETTNKLCSSVGESACNEAREDFNTMKKSFGYTFNFIKEVATNAGSKLVTVLEEWYKSVK